MTIGNKKVKTQYNKFLTAARATGCDESESAFDANLKLIAKAASKEQQKTKRKK